MRAAAILLCAMLAGCATAPSSCPAGLKPARTAELFFGRDIGAREGVSDADWKAFVEGEIAPRFPDGFMISNAAGAWRGSLGKTIRERTKRVFIVLRGAPGEQAKLRAIRRAYRTRFRQDSVLLYEGTGCAGF